MKELNLPAYDVRIRGTREKPEIFDFLRHRYIALTPEEWVRQHFVHYLIEYKDYPQGLLANEVKLQVGEKVLRCDTLLYNKEMKPQMIIEYKAPTVPLSQKVFDQITVYNILLHVDYLIVSNGMQHICCRIDHENQQYSFLPDTPSYPDL